MDKIAVSIAGIAGMMFCAWYFLMKNEKAVSVAGAIDIKVEGGYQPEVISVPVGKTTRISFTRTDANECLNEVIIPDFKIKKNLPLNQKVTIEIKPVKAGVYKYACSMNMYHGRIIAK